MTLCVASDIWWYDIWYMIWCIRYMDDTLWIAEPAPLHWLHPSHKRDCFGLPGFSFNCQWSSVTHRLLYIAYQFCNISAQVFSPTTYHSIVKCHFSHITHHSLYITLCDISVQVECAPLCQIGWYRNGTYLKNHTGVYSIQTRVKTQIQIHVQIHIQKQIQMQMQILIQI